MVLEGERRERTNGFNSQTDLGKCVVVSLEDSWLLEVGDYGGAN